MRKPINWSIIFLSIVLLFTISACDMGNSQADAPHATSLEANNETIQAAKKLLKDNLYYAETENIEGYLSTIPFSAHVDTQKAMEEFFETHEVSHELIAFEVVEENKDRIIAKTKQKTNGEDETGETEYRNHIAELLVVFEKHGDEWKITESSVTDINFMD